MYVPYDWKEPKWEVRDKVHNWRNYATDELRAIWNTFNDDQKRVVAYCLQEMASAEDWE